MSDCLSSGTFSEFADDSFFVKYCADSIDIAQGFVLIRSVGLTVYNR